MHDLGLASHDMAWHGMGALHDVGCGHSFDSVPGTRRAYHVTSAIKTVWMITATTHLGDDVVQEVLGG